MPNIFDEKGVVVQGIDDFRRDMTQTAQVKFADKLDGRDLRADDSSILGRIFASVAKPLTQNAEILPLILQAMDINSAEGQQLDNLLWNIHRIKRRAESQATGLVTLYGDVGTFIPKDSSVGNSLTGDNFKTDNDVTLSRSDTNGVDLVVDYISGRYVLSYTIDGFLSESPEVVVELALSDTTTKDVSNRLVDAINSQSSYLYASRNNDNSVRVNILDNSKTGSFETTGGFSIARVYTPAYVTSTTYDSEESLVGQITTIRTPTLGWRGVYNPFYIFASEGVESDEDYRERGKLFQQGSYGKFTSILMALKSVRGVTYENIQQNTSSSPTNSGIINSGLAVTVMGGNEDDVALALFENISEGIMTSGDIVKTVKDINGFGHEIRFSRPTITPLQIKMSLVTDPNFPNNGNARIKQAIVEWFNNLNVGEDVHYSRLYQPINSIQGFAVRNLKFGYKGATLSMEDVIIRGNEIAAISADDISIGS